MQETISGQDEIKGYGHGYENYRDYGLWDTVNHRIMRFGLKMRDLTVTPKENARFRGRVMTINDDKPSNVEGLIFRQIHS